MAGGLVLAAILLGLAVKTPTVPFHTWLPPAHTDASSVGSAVLAAVLLKMGTYGLVRIAMPMLPEAWRARAWVIIVVGIVSVLYGALAQSNLKRMVAYTSVNHMGYVVMAVGAAGLVAGDAQARGTAVTGAVTEMVSHGLITAALFVLVGTLHQQAGTYEMADFGGLAHTAPKLAGLFAVGAFASLGLPALSGFIAEFQVFTGSIAVAPVTAIALFGILSTVAPYRVSSPGANGTVATFLTTVPKIGAMVALYRFVIVLPDTVDWPLIIGLLAVVSMTLANLAAYWQQDPRRMLGWSTVSQVGFLLVPVAVATRSGLALPSLLLYLLGYTVTNVAAFAVTTALPDARDLADYRGLSRARPWLAASLLVALLGLVGTPPTVVFVGKLTTATAAWDGGMAWLTLAVCVNSLISLFYYLRWIIPVFSPGVAMAGAQTDEHHTAAPRMPGRWSSDTAVAAALLSVGLGLAGGLVWAVVSGPLWP